MARRGGNAVIELYGFEELLKKIEKAEGNLTDAVAEAVQRSAEPVKKDMQDFMDKHSPPNGSVWATGDTKKSWREQLTTKGDTVTYKIGYSIKDGGLPSIFLNYGTPTNEPSFFIDMAVERNINEIKKIQEETLREILEELM